MNIMNDRDEQNLMYDDPATYRIRIRRALNEQWSDCLGGMSITTSREGDHRVVTTLFGQLADQAALIGVVNSLYDLHRPILLLECLGQEAAD